MNSRDLREILLLSNRFKEGDLSIGGTQDPLTSLEARRALAALDLGAVDSVDLVEDGVSEA